MCAALLHQHRQSGGSQKTGMHCQVIDKGGMGAEWDNLYCKFVEKNKEVNVGSSRPCGT